MSYRVIRWIEIFRHFYLKKSDEVFFKIGLLFT